MPAPCCPAGPRYPDGAPLPVAGGQPDECHAQRIEASRGHSGEAQEGRRRSGATSAAVAGRPPRADPCGASPRALTEVHQIRPDPDENRRRAYQPPGGGRPPHAAHLIALLPPPVADTPEDRG